MSATQHTPARSVIDTGPDAIVQLLIACRRTLEHATVLTDHVGDIATAGMIGAAADAISMAMDQRILGGSR